MHGELVSNTQYFVEFCSNTHGNVLLPYESPSVYLPNWFNKYKNGSLHQFSSDPVSEKSYSINVERQSVVSEEDYIINLPAIDEELLPGIVPINIGISHCAIPPLHGDVIVEVLEESHLSNPNLTQILTGLGAEIDHERVYESLLRQPIIVKKDIPPDPLMLVYSSLQGFQSPEKSDILAALGLEEKDGYIGLFDPEIRKSLCSAVYILTRCGPLFKINPDFLHFDKYQTKLVSEGYGPYVYDEYDRVTGVNDIIKRLNDTLKPDYATREFILLQKLSRYYDDHPEVSEFYHRLPKPSITVQLRTRELLYDTSRIMSFAEFSDYFAALLPHEKIMRIPNNAQKHEDIPQDIQNILLTCQDGGKIAIFFSYSTSRCKEHRTEK